MDALYKYFDSEEEINDFQRYLEMQISYDKPGNQLFWHENLKHINRQLTDLP